jgi:hypothetical protein
MSTDAQTIAAALQDAALVDFSSWSATLRGHLAEEVEIRHSPPVPALDGWRDRAAAERYLEAEVEAFPRAFDSFAAEIGTEVADAGTIVTDVVYAGRLRDGGPDVRLGFRIRLVLREGAIALLDATSLPETSKGDLVLWLKAVDAAGGFHPPGPQRP